MLFACFLCICLKTRCLHYMIVHCCPPRYVHDGADLREDTFGLSVSDGDRTASTAVAVRVALVDDERPVAVRQIRGQAEVDEGGSVVLTSANIAATDNDTNDADLVFSIVQSPQYGDIEVGADKC